MTTPMAPITVTDIALDQIKNLLAQRETPALGIRIGLRSKGCSGLAYMIEYADEKNPYDEVVEVDDITILIDPKAIMHILGTQIDYVTEKFKAGFVFVNPNEKGRCGCGKSFHV